ncbi:hypothetical protein IOE58_01505 [Brachybacterium sp. Marseille-Q2903]|uniref:Uncharacterized protein n=2 Tax=Brachybacterium TaxID=43668 RepID=A0ABR9W0F4_9MICO|nr:hypothetical protein [Brachybacterium epidermidis]MBE9402930.1 hypothetical protein [Brachybacterium epidermidis]
MDIQNHYYGHSAVLARYAGLGSVRHINGLLQHGWTVRSPTLVHFSDFARLPRGAGRFVWSHSARGWDPERDPFPTIPVGAPFLYLSELTAQQKIEPLGRTVAFPVHDTRLVRLEHSDDAFARQLAERGGPSLVCLHPEDLDRPEKRQVWAAHGHQVVSAGDRRDPLFLSRVLHLARGARRVVSNQLSTAVVYAAAEGTPTEIYGDEVAIGSLGTDVARRTRELWPEFHDESDTATRQRIARAELGAQHVLSPEELRAALGWDRRSPVPFLSYWAGAPVRKAGAVLGVVKRPEGAQDAGSGASPVAFLAHPLSHLPSRLPRVPDAQMLIAEPVTPTP